MAGYVQFVFTLVGQAVIDPNVNLKDDTPTRNKSTI